MQQEEIREQQRETWNKFSPGWKKQDNFVAAWLRPIGDKIIELAALKDDYCILDVATGTGEPGLTAAKMSGSCKVIGADIAEHMVKIAREKARIMGLKNYDAHVSDETALSFDNNYFDAVVCRFGIMYFPDMLAGLREMSRVLKHGGILSLSAWSEKEKNPWATTAGKIVHDMLELPQPPADAPGIFRCAQPKTLTSLLTQTGMQNIKEVELTGAVIFDSAETYWEFITDVVAPIATALTKVDEATREGITHAVMSAARSRERDGKISFGWSTWVACGTK